MNNDHQIEHIDLTCARIGVLYAFVTPVDWWDGWLPVDTMLHNFIKGTDPDNAEQRLSEISSYEHFIHVAKQAARMRGGWEGDIREGIYATGLVIPGDPSSTLIFGWKHDNNGDTFIASPIAIPGWSSIPHVIHKEVHFKY